MSYSIDNISYVKTPLTDVCFISSDKEEIWYSKYQTSKHSRFLMVLFTSDPQTKIVNVEYSSKTIKNLFDFIEERFDLKSKPSDDLIDLYKLSHQWDIEKIECELSIYITEKFRLPEKTILVLKMRSNKHYIKSVEKLLYTSYGVTESNSSLTGDVCKIYQEVINVLKGIQFAITQNPPLTKQLLQEINISLSSIPGTTKTTESGINNNLLPQYSTSDKKILYKVFANGDLKDQKYFVDEESKTIFLFNPDTTTINSVNSKVVDNKKVSLTAKDLKILRKYQLSFAFEMTR